MLIVSGRDALDIALNFESLPKVSHAEWLYQLWPIADIIAL